MWNLMFIHILTLDDSDLFQNNIVESMGIILYVIADVMWKSYVITVYLYINICIFLGKLYKCIV